MQTSEAGNIVGMHLVNGFGRRELQSCTGTDAMFHGCNNGWQTAVRRAARRARRDMQRHPATAYTCPNGQSGLYLVQAALVMTKIQAQWR
jgi:hypothetical protein